MYYSKMIHDELYKVISHFCWKQIRERSVILEKCHEKQCLENKDHLIVCTNCGQGNSYEPMKEFCMISSMITRVK